MKIGYRLNVFESNSSSTHNMAIGTEDGFDRWKKGDILWSRSGFYSREEAIKILKNSSWYKDVDFDAAGPEILDEYLMDEGFYAWEQFGENEYLETDYHEFVTPKGEKVCVICEYGLEG